MTRGGIPSSNTPWVSHNKKLKRSWKDKCVHTKHSCWYLWSIEHLFWQIFKHFLNKITLFFDIFPTTQKHCVVRCVSLHRKSQTRGFYHLKWVKTGQGRLTFRRDTSFFYLFHDSETDRQSGRRSEHGGGQAGSYLLFRNDWICNLDDFAWQTSFFKFLSSSAEWCHVKTRSRVDARQMKRTLSPPLF